MIMEGSSYEKKMEALFVPIIQSRNKHITKHFTNAFAKAKAPETKPLGFAFGQNS